MSSTVMHSILLQPSALTPEGMEHLRESELECELELELEFELLLELLDLVVGALCLVASNPACIDGFASTLRMSTYF